MDAGISIGDFLRRYTVQVSDDGRSWTDIAMGPGRPSLTGEMVIALPSTTARHLRLVSGARGIGRAAVAVEDHPPGLLRPPDRVPATTGGDGHLDRRARQLGIRVREVAAPSSRREYRSITVARYSLPAAVESR